MKKDGLALMLKFIKDFNLKKIFFFVVCAKFVFLLPHHALALPEHTSPPLISEVIVKVDGRVEEDVRNFVSIKEGETLSLKKINEVIKYIYRTRAFSDIQVLKTGDRRVRLTFLLTKKLFTRRIVFSGYQEIPKKKLRESLYSLEENSHFSERRLMRAEKELKEVLRKEGYFHSEIRSFYESDAQSSSVHVFFEISPGKRYIIRKIDFVGEVLLQEDKLRKEMKSREGGVYIPWMVEEDIARLKEKFNSVGYQRAVIEIQSRRFDERNMNVFLSLKVNPHEKIEILVKGANIPLSLLRPIWEGEIFEGWGLREGEAKIIDFLRKKGHIFSQVHSSIKKAENEIQVIHKVDPGQRYRIEGVLFKGLDYFSPSELKKELVFRKKIPFLSRIDGERIFGLPREIGMLYKTQGFPQTRVDLNFIKQGKKVTAVFYIDEGKQERIDKISIEGTTLFPSEILLEQISSFEGGPFFQARVQKDIERLENFYLNQGNRGAEITAQFERKIDNLVSLRFNIREGKKVKIDKIVITGSAVTRRRTIRKELRIKEGDYAFYDKILETKKRLESLGIFSEVTIEEVPLSPERANLIINLREGHRNYAGLGLGLETKGEPYTFVLWNNEIRPRGTAEFIRGNILGTASQLSIVAQLSFREKRSVISWEQPYFFGIPWQSYWNAWIEDEDRKSFTFERRGISLTAIRSASKSLMLITTLRWVRTNLSNLAIVESEVDRQHHPFSAFSLSGSVIWDQRDDPFNPEKGSFLSFVAEWAYPLFKAESDYLKNFIKFQQFISINQGFSLSCTFRLGLGTGKIPIHERFFAGGSNSFRGERFDELGPKDPESHLPRGGKSLLLFNFELKFPLYPGLKDLFGAVFYDTGNIFPEIEDMRFSSLQNAVGIGIRYRTPMGPVRFDLGWNLSDPERSGKVLAFITIGNVF